MEDGVFHLRAGALRSRGATQTPGRLKPALPVARTAGTVRSTVRMPGHSSRSTRPEIAKRSEMKVPDFHYLLGMDFLPIVPTIILTIIYKTASTKPRMKYPFMLSILGKYFSRMADVFG